MCTRAYARSVWSCKLWPVRPACIEDVDQSIRWIREQLPYIKVVLWATDPKETQALLLLIKEFEYTLKR
jgi:hypothetical protein